MGRPRALVEGRPGACGRTRTDDLGIRRPDAVSRSVPPGPVRSPTVLVTWSSCGSLARTGTERDALSRPTAARRGPAIDGCDLVPCGWNVAMDGEETSLESVGGALTVGSMWHDVSGRPLDDELLAWARISSRSPTWSSTARRRTGSLSPLPKTPAGHLRKGPIGISRLPTPAPAGAPGQRATAPSSPDSSPRNGRSCAKARRRRLTSWRQAACGRSARPFSRCTPLPTRHARARESRSPMCRLPGTVSVPGHESSWRGPEPSRGSTGSGFGSSRACATR